MIPDWHAWASAKLRDGWAHEAIKQHIRDAWIRRGSLEPDPAPEALRPALAEVYEMACNGETPRACAVVYRSLAREFPEVRWLAEWAERWDAAGDDWRNLLAPGGIALDAAQIAVAASGTETGVGGPDA